jgi:hypothetical protein
LVSMMVDLMELAMVGSKEVAKADLKEFAMVDLMEFAMVGPKAFATADLKEFLRVG